MEERGEASGETIACIYKLVGEAIAKDAEILRCARLACRCQKTSAAERFCQTRRLR